MTEIPTLRLVVAAALSRADGRWLMHRRPAHKEHGGLWEFPGGKVEPGESPGNALVREVSEELGLDIIRANSSPSAFAESLSPDGLIITVILLYTIAGWHGEPVALEEGAEVGWFTPLEISALSRPPLDMKLAQSLFGEGPG